MLALPDFGPKLVCEPRVPRTRRPCFAYSPACEIITGPHVRGRYYDDGMLNVTEAGVDHVMRVFLRHYAPGGDAGSTAPAGGSARVDDEAHDQHLRAMTEAVQTMCDEELLRRDDPGP